MAGPQVPRAARRRARCAAAALAAALAAVGAAAAVRCVSQSSRLIWSQRLRINLRLIEPGAPADLKHLSRMGSHRVTAGEGRRPGERIEVWDFGPAQVRIRFSPERPEGLIMRIEGEMPEMAWPPGRAPGEVRGNLWPRSVVPFAVACQTGRR